MPQSSTVILRAFPHKLHGAKRAIDDVCHHLPPAEYGGDLGLKLRMLLNCIDLTLSACRVVAEEYELRTHK
jgi:hypothetical protein